MADQIDHRAEAEERLRASDYQRQEAGNLDDQFLVCAMHEAAMAQVHALLDLADAVRSRPAAKVPPGPCPESLLGMVPTPGTGRAAAMTTRPARKAGPGRGTSRHLRRVQHGPCGVPAGDHRPMPALVYRFAKPDGTGFYPPMVLVVDEDQMAKLAKLVASAAAAAIRDQDSALKADRRGPQGCRVRAAPVRRTRVRDGLPRRVRPGNG